MKRLILLSMLFCGGAFQLHAQEGVLLSPDAKSLGMGGLTTTVSGASHALYDNPAMAAFSTSQAQLSASYNRQGETDFYAVSGTSRFGENNYAALGWRQYLHATGNDDKLVDAGYVRRIGTEWGIGIVARYTHLQRPDASANALACDLSAAWSHPLEHIGAYSSLRVGAKIANIGGYFGKTAYELPTLGTVGLAWDTYVTDSHEITVGMDFGYVFNPSAVRGFQWSVGAEYNLTQFVQFRAGYHYGEHRNYNPCYTSVGAGIRFLHLRLDFAYLFAAKESILHNTCSFSFGLDF